MSQTFKDILAGNSSTIDRLYNPSLARRTSRVICFVNNSSYPVLIKKTLAPSFVGMTVGGAVGGILGLVGGPKGAALGASSGVGVGFAAGTSYATCKTRKEYKNWLRQYRSDELLPAFRGLFRGYPELQQFTCPLTKELMVYPFIDPWGYSYEKEAIEAWVAEHKTSPLAKQELSLSELRPDYILMGKMAKCYGNILKQEVKGVMLTHIQHRAISLLLKDLESQMTMCFFAENRLLLDLLKTGKISRITYACQLNLIAEALSV